MDLSKIKQWEDISQNEISREEIGKLFPEPEYIVRYGCYPPDRWLTSPDYTSWLTRDSHDTFKNTGNTSTSVKGFTFFVLEGSFKLLFNEGNKVIELKKNGIYFVNDAGDYRFELTTDEQARWALVILAEEL